MKILVLLILSACASYTDPNQEKLTYYKCDNNRVITSKHSDDYEIIVIRYNQDYQIKLHHFVSTLGSGYRNEKFLWTTKGQEAVLVEKQTDGGEKILFKNCRPE